MQCAARSRPASRKRPARRESTSFEPTLSVEAASSRRSSSGYSPANVPKPSAPVDSAAARRRSTTSFAAASETPASSYVLPLTRASLERGERLGEELGVELRPPARAAFQEPHRRLADLDLAV